MRYTHGRFSVGQSGNDEHNRIFGPPEPGSYKARLQGCTCTDIAVAQGSTHSATCPLAKYERNEHGA